MAQVASLQAVGFYGQRLQSGQTRQDVYMRSEGFR
jgi:hypothetical protein